MSEPFIVKIRRYCAGRLLISINSEPFEYEVSPYMAEKFKVQLRHNKGRAMALLRGHEVCIIK